MKVALVHDWLTGMRGGEAVLEELCERYPEAPIFTLVHVRGSVSPIISSHPIVTSFVQGLPLSGRKYRSYLPLFPRAIEQFDLSGFDLVISTSHCVAKGIRPRPGALHLCYCHTPMRYVWDQYDQYWSPGLAPAWMRAAMALVAPRLRRWDVASASRVGFFAANSLNVARRIMRHYEREAEVIYPPVDTGAFRPAEGGPGDYFLIVSAFVPYKRIDLAVEAFNRIGYPLKVVGSGAMESRLRAMARPNVEWLGWQDRTELAALYAGCRALIFPGEEDFGIVPVEAMAAGRPVIALGRGGALETVIPPRHPCGRAPTGLLFREQSVEGLIEGILQFEKHEGDFDAARIREHALAFDREVFRKALGDFIDRRVEAWERSRAPRTGARNEGAQEGPREDGTPGVGGATC
jgi:glycosyltransferase involved in cell wall biosynthesis